MRHVLVALILVAGCVPMQHVGATAAHAGTVSACERAQTAIADEAARGEITVEAAELAIGAVRVGCDAAITEVEGSVDG
jgi:hypothetical protein